MPHLWAKQHAGAVLLWCKAHAALGEPAYLAAAERAGEAVWQRGLLKKGPGACHGVSGRCGCDRGAICGREGGRKGWAACCGMPSL